MIKPVNSALLEIPLCGNTKALSAQIVVARAPERATALTHVRVQIKTKTTAPRREAAGAIRRGIH
jgi:hypothetical protein